MWSPRALSYASIQLLFWVSALLVACHGLYWRSFLQLGGACLGGNKFGGGVLYSTMWSGCHCVMVGERGAVLCAAAAPSSFVWGLPPLTLLVGLVLFWLLQLCCAILEWHSMVMWVVVWFERAPGGGPVFL